jgi:hypothetical protein
MPCFYSPFGIMVLVLHFRVVFISNFSIFCLNSYTFFVLHPILAMLSATASLLDTSNRINCRILPTAGYSRSCKYNSCVRLPPGGNIAGLGIATHGLVQSQNVRIPLYELRIGARRKVREVP